MQRPRHTHISPSVNRGNPGYSYSLLGPATGANQVLYFDLCCAPALPVRLCSPHSQDTSGGGGNQHHEH